VDHREEARPYRNVRASFSMRGDPHDHRATRQPHATLKAPGCAARPGLDFLFKAPLSLNASALDLHYDC
jgi:2'-5' RNA ligase